MYTDVTGNYAPYSDEEAARIIERTRHGRGPLLVVLHALQEAFGYLDEAALVLVADALNLSRAEVHGVLTFYHDFRREPPAPATIKICRAEACQAVGAEALVEHAEQLLSTKLGERSADGLIDLVQVFCLGNCALSPAVLVGDELLGRVTPERLDSIVAGIRQVR